MAPRSGLGVLATGFFLTPMSPRGAWLYISGWETSGTGSDMRQKGGWTFGAESNYREGGHIGPLLSDGAKPWE